MPLETPNTLNIDLITYEENTLSVIIRSHKEERLSLLDETLFSLAIQYWEDIEIIIALQNGTEDFKNKVIKLIEKQPFHHNSKFQVITVNIPPNFDGRSSLLNHGINCAKGRYIAFLDDDDFVYQHCYQTLITQLRTSTYPIVIGGCRTAQIKDEFGNSYIEKKENPFNWGNSKLDLITDNFIPIHSYVIDRTRIAQTDFYFDENFSLLEDYEFLLRLASKYEFDFTVFNNIVCEYRLHSDNSLPFSETLTDRHQAALELINEKKKGINFYLSVDRLKILLNNQVYAIKISQESNQDEIISSKSQHNPQLIRRILNSTGDKIYNFFSFHPTLEKRVSRFIHFFWNRFKRN